MNREIAIASLFALGLAGAAFTFSPALTGPFLFDSLSNLQHLADNGGIHDWETLIAFVFSGDAGRLGRPLALVSFLLHDISWPTDPWPFKYTNLLLHLLNGVLIFSLSRQLARLSGLANTRRDWFALGVAGVWLFHPMQLSATMLVIQRMNQLSTLFILVALIAYLHGRATAVRRPTRGYAWMTGAVIVGLPLAVLAKENGILLCGFALVLEATLLHNIRRPRNWRYWSAAFLVAPLALLAGYFLLNWEGVRSGFAHRDFTQGERLLTEARVLFDYLKAILLPELGGGGLFHDDYRISTGLLNPPSTALAVLALGLIIASALWLRTRYPAWSFTVLWFLVGHSLESSFISLELYFEHRNYLPMLGPIFGLIYLVARLPRRKNRIAVTGIALFIGLSAALSLQASAVWGNHALLATVWAKENPASARARQYAADYWISTGAPRAALYHLKKAAEYNPQDLSVHIQVVYVRCAMGDFHSEEFANLERIITTGSFSNATVTTIDQLAQRLEQRACGSLTHSRLLALLDQLLDNPYYRSRAQTVRNIWFSKAKIHIVERRLSPAIRALDRAYAASPNIDIPILQTGLLLSANLPEAASDYYQIALKINHNRAWYAMDRSSDLNKIANDIRAKRRARDVQ